MTVFKNCEWPHWVIPPACNTMMFELWNTGILASYLWKMNGYGVMSRRQHPIFLLEMFYFKLLKKKEEMCTTFAASEY